MFGTYEYDIGYLLYSTIMLGSRPVYTRGNTIIPIAEAVTSWLGVSEVLAFSGKQYRI